MSKRKAADEGSSRSTGSHAKKKYLTGWKPEYAHEFPCLVKGLDTSTAHCKLCNIDFKVCYGGRDDCRKHCVSNKHVNRSQAVMDTDYRNSDFL